MKYHCRFTLADILAAVLAQSAFRIRQSAVPRTGDPEFMALEKEIKISWLKKLLPLRFERGEGLRVRCRILRLLNLADRP